MHVSGPPPPLGHGVPDSNFQFRQFFPSPRFPSPRILGLRFLAWDPCQTRRGFNPSLPPQWPRAFRRADPFCRFVASYGPEVSDFSKCWVIFCGPKNHRKITSFRNAPKSPKSILRSFWGLILISFSSHFGIDFRSIFGTAHKSYFA